MNHPATLPEWAEWNRTQERPWTVGIEEELMLLDADDLSLANRIESVLPRLPEKVAARSSAETHNAALELATGIHHRVADACAELGKLRAEVADTLALLDLCGAGAGTHPFAIWEEVAVGDGGRQSFVHGSMRALARREPTFALHVHIGLPDPDVAIRVYNRMRVHLPLLLAISANSPYWQGRDTGLASARTPLFQGFPRVGIPRRFETYPDYVEAIDLLIRTDAIPDRSYLWWDIRPTPGLGTVEIRAMDAQSRNEDTASLVALVQCLVRLEAEEGLAGPRAIEAEEAISENRFLAARDGTRARLIDVDREIRRPVREIWAELEPLLRPHAEDLGCAGELEKIPGTIESPPADRQRALAEQTPSLAQMMRVLSAELA